MFICFFLHTCLGVSCVVQQRRNTPIPIGLAVDGAKGEQKNVFAEYGAPDEAWQRPMGVTQWVYCNASRDALLFEFDSDGLLLSTGIGSQIRVCASDSEIVDGGHKKEKKATPTIGPDDRSR